MMSSSGNRDHDLSISTVPDTTPEKDFELKSPTILHTEPCVAPYVAPYVAPHITPHIVPHIAFLAILTVFPGSLAKAAEAPWLLDDAVNLPQGFIISGTQESRFENLSDNVQLGASDNDQVLAMRTTLDIQYLSDELTVQLEIADTRQQLADEDSFLKNRTVNAADILQATAGFRLGAENNTHLRVGRFTEDWGSRRLMARNRFRNAINTFEGLVIHHQGAANSETRFMATQVVRRRPSSFEGKLHNKRQSDASSSAQRFHGIHSSMPELFSAFDTELFYYGLREKDTPGLQTANRNLHTLGFRLRKTPSVGNFDYEVESIYQIGDRRASRSSTDTTALDHEAAFQFLALGYSFRVPSALRVVFEFDYASGDDSPFDQESGRFDSLFGPTTFEFGVVGLYDVYNRSNLITPGIRLTANLAPRVNIMASYRHFWLAEKRDSWGRTGLRDVSGESGSYVGQHLQLRLRWEALPGNLRIESGVILQQAKNLSDNTAEYFYLESELRF